MTTTTTKRNRKQKWPTPKSFVKREKNVQWIKSRCPNIQPTPTDDFDFFVPKRWNTLGRLLFNSRGLCSSTVTLRLTLLDIFYLVVAATDAIIFVAYNFQNRNWIRTNENENFLSTCTAHCEHWTIFHHGNNFDFLFSFSWIFSAISLCGTTCV